MDSPEPEPEPCEPELVLTSPEPSPKRRKLTPAVNGSSISSQDLAAKIAEARENPRALPDWDSDAQHSRDCQCDICCSYYLEFALSH